MKIELTRGFVAVVDDEDFELMRGFRWVANRSRGSMYARANVTIDGKSAHVMMHRLIFGVTDPKVLVDHKDGDSLNNRRGNLRVCTHAENMRNSKTRISSKTQIKNVMRSTNNGTPCFDVCVRKDHVRYRKRFPIDKLEEATAYAKELRIKLHGEFEYMAGGRK